MNKPIIEGNLNMILTECNCHQ